MPDTMRERMQHYFKKTNLGFATLTGFDFTRQPPLSRTKAIRAKCLECQGGSEGEVRKCQVVDCSLWPYRMGSASKAKMLLESDSGAEIDAGDE